jgi:hypothetical protein
MALPIYDGKGARLVGRYANLQRNWSAAALILTHAHELLDDPSLLSLLPE